MRFSLGWFAALVVLLPQTRCPATEFSVSKTAEFSAALAAPGPGDSILMAPGVYAGGHFRAGLTNVTIRAANPAGGEAILQGGVNGLQLSDATNVTLDGLVFEQQTGNGLNIDDGGSFATPSTGITIRNVTVRDLNAAGNNDGIKLSGVTGFLIDRVRVYNWGPGGSAVDPVGSHNGVFSDNTIEYSDSWHRVANFGPEVDAASFTFDSNRWLNGDDPTPGGSAPGPPLPAVETNPLYGVAAPFAADEPMRWSMPWGEWIVPLDAGGATLPIADADDLLLATPGEGAEFDALSATPLSGEWSFTPAPATVSTQPFEPIVLIRPEACGVCSDLPGDYDRSGAIDEADYLLWQAQFAASGGPLADGNGDGTVDVADYTVWRDSAVPQVVSTPEPASGMLAVLVTVGATRRRIS